MRFPRKWIALLLGSQLFFVGIVRAEGLHRECIGAYELTLPGKVEFALFPDDYLVNQDSAIESVFADGATAPAVRFFAGNNIEVTAAPDSKSLAFLKAKVGLNMERHKQRLVSDGDAHIAKEQAFYNLQRANSFSTKGVVTVHHYEWMKGNIYHFEFRRGKFSDSVAALKKFLADFHPRQPFETVDASRICIPYGDVGLPFKAGRELSVAMRMSDHPEVEILFQDTLYMVNERSEPFHGPEHQLTYHWERRHRGDYSKVDYSWPKFESFNTDGMKGKSTSVTLFRAGGPKDRGFAAYENSEEDGIRREIMLIVTRNSSRALRTPISTDEFDKLAKSIASSIRRRVQ